MPNFSYVAVDSVGKSVKGVIEAPDRQQALNIIKSGGKTPVSVAVAGRLSQDLNLTLFERKPKPRELAVFCRQFVSISSAGVPVISALEMLAQQTENPILSRTIYSLGVSIQQGNSLTDAMSEHPKIFSTLFVKMVATGEASGSLELAFERMGLQLEKDAKLKALIQRSSIYPIIVSVVALGVIIALLAFVVPSFEDILSDLGTDMPAFSAAILAAGKFMQANWYIVVGAIVAAILFVFRFDKTETGHMLMSQLQIKLPLFGKLVSKTASARMCRTLSTLVTAGIPLIDAIEIVADVMTNELFKQALLRAREDVMMGVPLSEPLSYSGIFPPLVTHMTRIGEESGDLDGMLEKLADYFDEEVENTTASIMAAIEPAIIIFLAAIVGVIVMAIMLPLGEIYNGLDNL